MKGTIEIIIRKNESGALCTEVTARGCKREDITFAGLLGAMNLVVNDMDKDMSEADKKEAAKVFGGMMARMMFLVLKKETVKQKVFEGKEAEVLSALMKRQGEVQDQ